MIVGIVAIAKNNAIGKDGKLPWHYPADLKFFKRTTLNHAIVMGYNTWDSIGKPLPKRLSIVLSRSRNVEHRPRVVLMRDKKEVISVAKYLRGDLFVIGGAQTYKAFADTIDKWIVTEIPEVVKDADAFMPSDFLNGFELDNKNDLGNGLIACEYLRNLTNSTKN